MCAAVSYTIATITGVLLEFFFVCFTLIFVCLFRQVLSYHMYCILLDSDGQVRIMLNNIRCKSCDYHVMYSTAKEYSTL